MSIKAYSFFETSFNRCRDQFEEAGLIPAVKENFLSFDKAIATLSNDENETLQPCDEGAEATGHEGIE